MKKAARKNWHLVPENLAKQSVFKVEKGKLTIGGKIVLKMLGMMDPFDEADNLQSMVKNTIFPGATYNSIQMAADHEGSLDNSDGTKEQLMNEVKEDFKETEWQSYVN